MRSEGVDLSGVPDYGTPEADGHRLSFNGKLPKQPRGRPAEPTHALPEPPCLVDGVEETPEAARSSGLITGLGGLLIVDAKSDCPVCLTPRTRVGRWTYCLNETCTRYEEPI